MIYPDYDLIASIEADKFNKELRDKFAMAALTGMLGISQGFSPSTVTDDAYILADEMLLARKRIPYETN